MSLNTSENQTVRFPKLVLTFFWCTTSYTVIFVLWKTLMEPVIAPAHRWPSACLKCVSSLRRLEKFLNFFEMHSCLWPGAQIWFRHKWRKLVTASLLLHCIDWYSCVRYWIEFFSSCVSCFRLKFSPIALWRKRLQLDSKSDLTTNGLNMGFFLEIGVFRWLHIWVDWNLQESLNCCSFLTTWIFFDI